jgi:uncharacterized RDD family membrane protein YckC
MSDGFWPKADHYIDRTTSAERKILSIAEQGHRTVKINETTLREHYAALSSEQLLELHGRGTLTAQATQVLSAVLDERGVSVALRADVAGAAQADRAARARELQLLEYLRASWRARLLARFIDTAIVVAGFVAAGVLLAQGSTGFGLLLLAPSVLYFMFADSLPKGQSLGKRVVDIAVVDGESLEPCTPLQAVQRNKIMAEALGWLLMLVMAIGRGRAGFGGKTLVVRRSALAEVTRR